MINNKRIYGIFFFGMVVLGVLVYLFVKWQLIQATVGQIFALIFISISVTILLFHLSFKALKIELKHWVNMSSQYKLTVILYDLLKKLAHEENSKNIYDAILSAAAKAIPSSEFGSIILKKKEKMFFEASFGYNHDYLELIEFTMEETALYKITNGKMDRAVIIPEILSINESESTREFVDILKKIGVDKIKSTISAPIYIGDEVIGSLNLDSKTAHCFNKQDIDTLEIFAFEVGKFVQLHRVNELNRRMSRYDDLTQIYNRGFCKKEIKELIKKKIPFVIVSADLNRLKMINDEYGHDMGDQYLLTFVNITKLFIDGTVIFSRYGGDEFMLVFPKVELLSVKVIIDDIINYLKTHKIELDNQSINVSFSYGIAAYPEDHITYDELLKVADARMYEAKNMYKDENHKI